MCDTAKGGSAQSASGWAAAGSPALDVAKKEMWGWLFSPPGRGLNTTLPQVEEGRRAGPELCAQTRVQAGVQLRRGQAQGLIAENRWAGVCVH